MSVFRMEQRILSQVIDFGVFLVRSGLNLAVYIVILKVIHIFKTVYLIRRAEFNDPYRS
jgi:hypothetical protein